MKIAHVSFAVEQSVERKTALMAQAAREQKLPVDFYVFAQHSAPCCNDNLFIRRLPLTWLGRKIAPKVQWPFRLISVARALKDGGYDVVIMRYPKLPFGWRLFLRRLDVPVVTEHHTNEPAEIRGDGGFLRVAAEKTELFMRRRFLSNVQGLIGVTGEVLAMVRNDAPGTIPGIVVTNGVRVESVPLTGFSKFDGRALRMVFVASDFIYWHGLDRLLAGMLRYQGEVAIELRLVGLVPACYRSLVERCNQRPQISVVCCGAVYGEPLNAKFENMNLAIASLGLYRKNMKEACPLKSREYIARGLPFVYGYTDPDIPEDCPYALRVPNTPEPVDMQRVVAFAASASTVPDLANTMRARATRDLDVQTRIRAMCLLAESVCHSA